MRRRLGLLVLCGVILSARASYAGALGIPLDGFLTTFQTFVVGLGLIIPTVCPSVASRNLLLYQSLPPCIPLSTGEGEEAKR